VQANGTVRAGELLLEGLSSAAGRVSEAAALAKAEVVRLARECHGRGWAPATSGTFSVRVATDRMAVTASRVDKGRLAPSEVVLVALDGSPLEHGTPSAEAPLHASLYRGSPEVGAIVHTHSIAAIVLSRHFGGRGTLRLLRYELAKALAPVQNNEPPELDLPILRNLQDRRALAALVQERLEKTPAFGYLVDGHGLTTWGRDAAQALCHVEALEFMLACELTRFTAGALSWRSAAG
jgi:methylthioribulose-1-phosphate dehydratase